MKRALFPIAWVLLALVFGVGTPAGTEIRNQASASYVDSAGRPQTTTSNEVVTVVQPVFRFEIKPDSTKTPGETGFVPGQTQSALAGAPVYFHYTVTNTGNTEDTINLQTVQDTSADDFDFENPKIYLDDNCNGQVDPGESEVASVTLAADASACLVVEARIPLGKSDGQKGNLNLKGTSQGDPAQIDENNWAQAVVTSKAVLSVTKGASVGGEVRPGETIAYTIEGQNTGGRAAGAVTNVVTVDGSAKNGIFVSDEIPANTTYVKGSAKATAGAGTASVVYRTSSGWTATEPDTASAVEAVGLLIEGTGAFFPQGAQFRLEFSVTVNAGVPAGTLIENAAVVRFDANEDGDAEDAGEVVETNTTTNPVAQVAGVQNGPNGDPDADGNGFVNSYTDPSGKTWNYVQVAGPDGAKDGEKIANSVYGGNTVYFRNTLKNTGNAEDSYTLNVSGVPSGWTCQVLAADGTTPLSGPVGPVGAGATLDYVVKCSIPPTYTSTSDTELTVTAVSEADPDVANATKDVVPPVQSGYQVDIDYNPGNNDGARGDGNPPAKRANPGETVFFPFDVHNTGQNPDTYDLSAQVRDGFPTDIYPDENCDGRMDDPAPAPVSDTGLMNPGATKCFILRVQVPEGQAPVDKDGNPGSEDDNVEIVATSHTVPEVSDKISTDLEVNAVARLSFTPDRSGTVTSPGTIVYTHTLTNSGNEPADVTFSLSGSSHPTWTYQLSTDGGKTWKPVNASRVDGLGAGMSQEIRVRVIVPDGEPIGAVDQVQITATGAFQSGGVASASVTDTTTVVGGELRLEKSARTCEDVDCTVVSDPEGSEAKPGDYLEYTIVATNIGTADLKQVVVSDPLPSYTEFVSVSATTTISGGRVLYSTDGSTWSTTPPSTLSAGQSVYVAVDTDGDTKITDADLMPPSTRITVTFKVKVK